MRDENLNMLPGDREHDDLFQQAVERFVENQTFLLWVLSGVQSDGSYASPIVRTIAELFPAFMEQGPLHSSDLAVTLSKWLKGKHTDESWQAAVEQYAARDPRVLRGFAMLQEQRDSSGSTTPLLPYEKWKSLVWDAQAVHSTSLCLEEDSPPLPPVLLPGLIDGHYHTGSDSTIQALREAIAMNTFRRVEDSPWPTATLSRGETHGHAQLRPVAMDDEPIMPPAELDAWQTAMWKQREELSDLDVDTLDALNAIWLNQAKSENHGAVATVDAILKLRGVQQKKSGRGYRGGFEPEQRRETFSTLAHLQSVWVTMAALPAYESTTRRKKTRVLQSRAFVITDRTGQLRLDGYMDVDAFMFRPGDVLARVLFGPGRQTALMSAMALRYNPHSQTWEKRLTRYLSWQWRCRARNDNYMQPFKIATLLQAAGETVDPRRPSRTRDRLEKALDTILKDAVITGWQYERWDESSISRHRWINVWLQTTVLIEPPDVIREQYKKLESMGHTEIALPPATTLGEQLERKRKSLGLSQLQAAEQLGISQPYWSRLTKGKRGLESALREKIQEWLAKPHPTHAIPQA